MKINYVDIIANKFPNVFVSCLSDPSIYTNILYEGGDPMPSEQELYNLSIKVAQEIIWSKIKIERDTRKAGGVKVGSFWFHSDDASRIQQIALVMLGANMPAGIQWKTMTGAFTTMTPQLASQIFQTTIGSDQTIFGKAEQHRQAMMAEIDPQSYNYLTGWPITYVESPEYVP